MNQFLGYVFVIVVMLVGLDFLFRSGGPRAHGAYRRWLGRVRAFLSRQMARFIRWAWREYSQFIVGFATGILAALYYTGHLQ